MCWPSTSSERGDAIENSNKEFSMRSFPFGTTQIAPLSSRRTTRRARRVVRREESGAICVVPNGNDLIENSLFEFSIASPLSELVDGQHIYRAQRLEPFPSGHAVRKAVPD